MTQEFINQCQRNLIDLTARNALINFKFNSGYSYCKNRAESLNQNPAQSFVEIAIKKPKNSDDFGAQEKLKNSLRFF